MVKIRVTKKDLIWDEKNVQHIARHNLNRAEVEKVLDGQYKSTRTYEGRIMLIGKSDSRIVSIVLAKEVGGYYPITARDASKKERRIYRNEQI